MHLQACKRQIIWTNKTTKSSYFANIFFGFHSQNKKKKIAVYEAAVPTNREKSLKLA